MRRDQKSKLVQMRVKEDTWRRWKDAARASNLSLSEWLRIRANGADITAQPPKAA